jgi:tight adherence protein C
MTLCLALLDGLDVLAFWPGGLLLLSMAPWQSWQSLRQQVARRLAAIERDLPGWLELLALGLEAGTAFPAALVRALARAPDGPLRQEFERLVQALRSGHARSDALRRLDARLGLPALSSVVAAIVQAEASGLSLAPVLRAQSRRATQERFARAEKRAMEAPVKMLGPLVLCIFPCTFIVVGFPIAAMLFWGG